MFTLMLTYLVFVMSYCIANYCVCIANWLDASVTVKSFGMSDGQMKALQS